LVVTLKRLAPISGVLGDSGLVTVQVSEDRKFVLVPVTVITHPPEVGTRRLGALPEVTEGWRAGAGRRAGVLVGDRAIEAAPTTSDIGEPVCVSVKLSVIEMVFVPFDAGV